MPACGWTVDTSCIPDWGTYTEEQQARASGFAIEILHALTGRRFGACPVTVRPCGPRCREVGGWWTYPVRTDGWVGGSPGGVLAPFIRDGAWFNCGCNGGCSCRATEELWLPGPVASVGEVQVGPDVLDPTAYRIDNGDTLVRVDGGRWPECQDMDGSLGDPNTLFVTYSKGLDVPLGGQIAAGMLAGEFAKACTGQPCGLPGALSSLSRQGVEVQMIDPTNLLESGLTGIQHVDLWIRAVNPARKSGRSRVWSPDLDKPRQVQ